MNPNDEIEEDEHTAVIAVFSSMMSLPAIYAATRPVIWLVHPHWFHWVPWLLTLMFTLMPTVVAFIILYFGFWHREWQKPKRILLAILASCLIYGADILIIGYGFAVGVFLPDFEAGH